MARRSIEMYEYRQALMRMRQGDSEREIARSKLMGRSKAARFRELARAQAAAQLHAGAVRRLLPLQNMMNFSRACHALRLMHRSGNVYYFRN